MKNNSQIAIAKSHKYYCEKCQYTTNNKFDYNKHCSTQKHKNENDSEIKETKKSILCDKCSQTFNSKTTLWRHKKTCKEEQVTLDVVEKEKNDVTALDIKLILELLKQNNEFKELLLTQNNQLITNNNQNTQIIEQVSEQTKSMMEIVKTCNTTNNIVNGNVNNNTQNTQFNIQMYLNETCKNAMTIDEFLDYLQPTIEELEDTARLGYVEGITRIIMRGLKDLEEELRPFHCTDLKRESLFVKNPDGEWEKETDEKPLMLKFVKAVARKNFNNVNKWRQEHPNCRYHDSKSNDMFNQIMLNSTSGRTEKEQQESYQKIIKNIVKEVVVDKSKKNKSK
jgi:hypothetical protein